MNFSKPLIAAAALAAALSLAACGSSSDGNSNSDGGSTTTANATSSEDAGAASTTADAAPALPTVEELNAKVQMALDPNVPAEEKADSVEGLDEDPELIQQLAGAIVQAEADGLFSNPQVVGPLTPVDAETVSVPLTFEVNGEPQQGGVEMVLVDGEWKLAKSSICSLAGLLSITSPSCPAV